MRIVSLFLLMLSCLSLSAQQPVSENVIIVTLDGYRWQELFGGAQAKLYNSDKFNHGLGKLGVDYWDEDPLVRRKKLMPFFWNTIVEQGQIYGNRKEGNKMSVSNFYKVSYPGYSEIFCGWGDKKVKRNNHPDNTNSNIFDFLQADAGFTNKMVAVATWDAFPRILNEQRSKVPVFVNMKPDSAGCIKIKDVCITKWNTTIPKANPFAETDTFTYHFAKEYLYLYHPRVAFIGLDETDHFGHAGNYAAYLGSANTADKYIEDLWNFIQSDAHYKDKTTLIITTDHGRGNVPKKFWEHHGWPVAGAQQIWMAVIGAGISPKGEVKHKMHLKQNQIAATIAALLGQQYKVDHFTGKPIVSVLAK